MPQLLLAHISNMLGRRYMLDIFRLRHMLNIIRLVNRSILLLSNNISRNPVRSPIHQYRHRYDSGSEETKCHAAKTKVSLATFCLIVRAGWNTYNPMRGSLSVCVFIP